MTSLSIEEENYVRMGLLLTGISPRAARALFDQEFAPTCLCAALKKEYNTLSGLKKTRVINQSQWNLLFPRFPDVPKSDTFDVTLIIALLRNLTNLNPPHSGFDCLPTANETTPGSDLARIKYYRNYLAHLNKAMLENNFFNTSWEDISQAIGRLGGTSMKQECDILKTKPLDQSNKEIIMEIKHSNEAIEQLTKSFRSLKRSHEEDKRTVKRLKTSHKIVLSENKKVKKKLQTLQNKMVEITAELNEGIPKNIREQINKQIELWEKEDLMFVSTRASDYVIKCLKKNSCVTLTGPSGVGKSFTGRHAALFLQKKEYSSSHNKTSNTEFIIEIPDRYSEAYLKRLINDWSNGMVRSVFDKKDMKESYFRERFLQFLQFLLQLDKSKQITLINTKDTRGNICKPGGYPLTSACEHGFTDIVTWILDNDVDVDQCRDDGVTGLYIACKEENTAILNMLLEKNCNVDLCDNNGITPIINSCRNNNINIVKLLLQYKPNINAQAHDGSTALYFSILYGNVEMTQLLLVHQADCNICIYSKDHLRDIHTNHATKSLSIHIWNTSLDREKNEIINILISNTSPVIADYVSRRRVDTVPKISGRKRSTLYSINKSAYYALDIVAGSSPFHIACFMGMTDVVRCLLDHKANINMTKEDGTTPLSFACELGHTDIVKILLEKNANVDTCDNDGLTPVIKACMNNHTSTVQLLIKYKPDINARTFDGTKALFFSALHGNLEITKLLLENNADCNNCIHRKQLFTKSLSDNSKETSCKQNRDFIEYLVNCSSTNVTQCIIKDERYVFGIFVGSSPLHIACFYVFRHSSLSH